MSILSYLKSKFLKPSDATDVVKTKWRNNMWVMTPDGIGIIFELGVISKVHLIGEDGLTKAEVSHPQAELRQALYKEIPECRRGDKVVANNLGYF